MIAERDVRYSAGFRMRGRHARLCGLRVSNPCEQPKISRLQGQALLSLEFPKRTLIPIFWKSHFIQRYIWIGIQETFEPLGPIALRCNDGEQISKHGQNCVYPLVVDLCRNVPFWMLPRFRDFGRDTQLTIPQSRMMSADVPCRVKGAQPRVEHFVGLVESASHRLLNRDVHTSKKRQCCTHRHQLGGHP